MRARLVLDKGRIRNLKPWQVLSAMVFDGERGFVSKIGVGL